MKQNTCSLFLEELISEIKRKYFPEIKGNQNCKKNIVIKI